MLNILRSKLKLAKKNITSWKSAFTYVEIIFVMLLISIIMVATIKVIMHNEKNKVPLYVYYLYKQLDNESYVFANYIDKSNPDKNFDEILASMNVQNYCTAMAEELNTVGDINCANSKELSAASQNQTVDCERDYKFSFDMDANPIRVSNPVYSSSLPQCKDDYSDICQHKPNFKISIMGDDNTKNYWAYKCTSSIQNNNDNNTLSSDIQFDPTQYPRSFNLINNVKLNFLFLNDQKRQYTYKVNLTQTSLNTSMLFQDFENCSINAANKDNYVCELSKGSQGSLKHFKVSDKNSKSLIGLSLYNQTLSGASEYSEFAYYVKKNMFDFYANDAIADAKRCNTQNCDLPNYKRNFLNDERANVIEKYLLKIDAYGADVWLNIKATQSDKQSFWPLYKFLENMEKTRQMYPDSIEYNEKSSGRNGFYTEYHPINAFTNYINKSFIEEREEYPYDKTHIIIYAAIDTTFKLGKMNEDIFAFEQFGKKIIPIGYLANNINSPLKFDVIARNLETSKIEKVNYKEGSQKRALTFCEAMKYTGSKFSQYCGCKDEDNNIVKQYPIHQDCNNKFGCIIRPVKPNVNAYTKGS